MESQARTTGRLWRLSELFSRSSITDEDRGPSTNVCWFQENGRWARLAFMRNYETYHQGCCIVLEFYQWGVWWIVLGYSEDWLIIPPTVPGSQIPSCQITICMPRVRANPSQRDSWQGHCVSNVMYPSMTLSCPQSPAPSCSALELCYQACACLNPSSHRWIGLYKY